MFLCGGGRHLRPPVGSCSPLCPHNLQSQWRSNRIRVWSTFQKCSKLDFVSVEFIVGDNKVVQLILWATKVQLTLLCYLINQVCDTFIETALYCMFSVKQDDMSCFKMQPEETKCTVGPFIGGSIRMRKGRRKRIKLYINSVASQRPSQFHLFGVCLACDTAHETKIQ